MKSYEVYFEVFGKKMKATIEAKSEEDAKYILLGKVKFHKVVLKNDDNNIGDFFGGIFK